MSLFFILAVTVNELDALSKLALEEFLLDVPPVGTNLSIEHFCEHEPYTLVPIVHVCSCETECYQLSEIVAEQAQLESVRPPHGAPATFGKTQKILLKCRLTLWHTGIIVL